MAEELSEISKFVSSYWNYYLELEEAFKQTQKYAVSYTHLDVYKRQEKDFQVVVGEWDKLDRNRERRERDHENLRGDVPLEYKAVPEPKLIPRWMNNPAYRQLMAGNFLDILFDCPYAVSYTHLDVYKRQVIERCLQP